MSKSAIAYGFAKACMFREALASCQIEGIGLNLTLEDLYLGELGFYKSKKKEKQYQQFALQKNEEVRNSKHKYSQKSHNR